MDFGKIDTKSMELNNRKSNPADRYKKSNFRQILHNGRLTEEDLHEFYVKIQKAHQKKHFRVLGLSALIIISLAILAGYYSI